jgi:hypothetical protein
MKGGCVMDLPGWMDAGRLAMIGIVTLAAVQYVKTFIPEKWVKPSALPLALIVSFMLHFAETSIYVKLAVYAIFAVVVADTGYSFLSTKPTKFSLPSKVQAEESKEQFMPQTKADAPK